MPFSQLCPNCQWVITAEFCGQDACRRKFVLQPRYSVRFCPLHDPAVEDVEVPRDIRAMKFERALFCPRCRRNLLGYKPEDREQKGELPP